uniref:MSP domain-containing protein n=1 Tax=Caenorhabditis tropicalis TaxID=1561998 RepID=A0A1I7TGH9_9PELO
MGVELSLDPPVCPIQANGGTSKHKIINHCDKMLAYKIKSSNNSNYSVNTIYGLIQIGYTADLIITRKPGKPQADRLVIQFAAVEQTCRDPKAIFANGPPTGELCGETIIKLSAAE